MNYVYTGWGHAVITVHRLFVTRHFVTRLFVPNDVLPCDNLPRDILSPWQFDAYDILSQRQFVRYDNWSPWQLVTYDNLSRDFSTQKTTICHNDNLSQWLFVITTIHHHDNWSPTTICHATFHKKATICHNLFDTTACGRKNDMSCANVYVLFFYKKPVDKFATKLGKYITKTDTIFSHQVEMPSLRKGAWHK